MWTAKPFDAWEGGRKGEVEVEQLAGRGEKKKKSRSLEAGISEVGFRIGGESGRPLTRVTITARVAGLAQDTHR